MLKNNFKISSKFYTLTSMVVGVIFLLSGVTKLIDFYTTGFTVEQYLNIINISPSWCYSELIAVAIVAFELSLGIFLLISHKTTLWLTIAFLTLCIFTIINIVSIIDGKMLECGCFGYALQLTPMQSLIKNLLIATLIILVLLFSNHTTLLIKPPLKWFTITFIITFISGCAISLFQPITSSNRYCQGSKITSAQSLSNEGIDIDWLNNHYDEPLHRGYYTVFIVRDLERISSKDKEFFNKILELSSQTLNPILLSNSSLKELDALNFNKNQIGQIDHSTIMQLISSPFGIITIDNGIILNKWQQTFLNGIPPFIKNYQQR